MYRKKKTFEASAHFQKQKVRVRIPRYHIGFMYGRIFRQYNNMTPFIRNIFLSGGQRTDTKKISQKICRENGNLVYVVRFLMPTECNLTYFCSYFYEKENKFQGHLQLATWWIFCPWKTNRINSKTALSYVCSRHSKNSSHFFLFLSLSFYSRETKNKQNFYLQTGERIFTTIPEKSFRFKVFLKFVAPRVLGMHNKVNLKYVMNLMMHLIKNLYIPDQVPLAARTETSRWFHGGEGEDWWKGNL